MTIPKKALCLLFLYFGLPIAAKAVVMTSGINITAKKIFPIISILLTTFVFLTASSPASGEEKETTEVLSQGQTENHPNQNSRKYSTPPLNINKLDKLGASVLHDIPKDLGLECPDGTISMEKIATSEYPRHIYFCKKPEGIIHGPIIVLNPETKHRVYEMTVANGVIHGKFKTFDEDSGETVESFYHDGILHGQSTAWYGNGKKSSLSIWKHGELVSIKLWNEEGKLVPKPRLIITGLSNHYRNLIMDSINMTVIQAELHFILPETHLIKLEIQFPKKSGSVRLTYSLKSTKAFKELHSGGYINYKIINAIDMALLPTSFQIAGLLNATYGQYGSRDEPGIFAYLRIVGRLSSVEMELTCGHDGFDCITTNHLDCLRKGKKVGTVYPSEEQDYYDSGILKIGPPIDISGKTTENKCFWDVWR